MEPKIGQLRLVWKLVVAAVVFGLFVVVFALFGAVSQVPVLLSAVVLFAVNSIEICRNVPVRGTWQDNTSFELERKVWKPYLHWTIRLVAVILTFGFSVWAVLH